MATAPKILEAPCSDDTRILTYSGRVQTTIAVRNAVTDFNEATTHTNVLAPAGSTQLFSVRRQCGDWYAEFTAGQRITSAVHLDQPEAVRLAALAMEAA